MSTQEAAKGKAAWESLKELLEKTDAEVRRQVRQATPVVQRSVGASIEAGTKAFDTTMKSVSKHTEREQVELLKAYRKFLSSQSEFVNARLKSLDDRNESQQRN